MLLALLGSHAASLSAQESEPYQQVTLRQELRLPGVDLPSYSLITRDPESDRREAEAIMQVKISWPRAMQTKDAALFDRILARGFTFREADGTLLQRDAYIRDRVGSTETVGSVRYENVVLQPLGEMAVLSYRNVVSGTDAGGNRATWHMSWIDIFIREEGRWKIAASHLIGKGWTPSASEPSNNEMQRTRPAQAIEPRC